MRMVFTREMAGWEPVVMDEDRVVFRPGPEAWRGSLSLSGLALLLSVILLFAAGWKRMPWPVAHAALWTIAIAWPLSLLYQRREFVKEPDRGVVVVRTQGVIFSSRKTFPVGRTGLWLNPSPHYLGEGSSVQTGFDWDLILGAGSDVMTFRLGFTVGTEQPVHVPIEVRKASDCLGAIFETPVDVQTTC